MAAGAPVCRGMACRASASMAVIAVRLSVAARTDGSVALRRGRVGLPPACRVRHREPMALAALAALMAVSTA